MAEDGKFLGDGEIGEIVVRAGNVMKGYYETRAPPRRLAVWLASHR